MNTSLPLSRRLIVTAVLVVVLALVGAIIAQTAPDPRRQGRALLDAVVRQVQQTFIRRVADDQLYAGATKALLEEAGTACARRVTAPQPTGTGRARFYALLDRVEAQCADPQRGPDALYLAAAKGMLEALGDQYTRLMDPRAYQMFLQDTQGFFSGIGIYIDVKDDYPIVVQPIANTPAARAGLKAGDRIVVVDGVATRGMSLQEAVTRIRGKEGTPVRLRIRRGEAELDVTIVRARIQITAAEGPESLDEATRQELARQRIGYVKLITFNHERAVEEFDRVVEQARRDGARALIFDLRTNGGGLLDQAIRVASRFLPTGQPILHLYDRNGRRASERSRRGAKIALPTVVLVNEFSASASEIVAGALQDSGTATIVGVHTFGKNLIQSIVDLPMGAGAAITSAKWVTPRGQDISGKGLTPDVVVGEPEERLRATLKGRPEAEVEQRLAQMRAEQLRRAVEILRQKLQRSLRLPAAA
ncbi:MAG: S41 family peptidase [Armatimonadota bacterium]|nr:S41 family peptidase [Armatimonadota bacterium]MDR7466743.1 S41 family peptidase [Armatimonadota bacterium]MDR7492783.1 S41 family peptidase [Armatimonadota bacterium]MDR7498559.1 S41 family peptidase [Armatimonadota bacterium]MDR7504338.1 S41 family peptidase [Armatimonadota bacterium]